MSVDSCFLEWFTANGAHVSPKIDFKDYSGEGAGRGVIATEDIKCNEILFSLPRTMLLSPKNSKFKTDLIRHVPKLGWSRIMWAIVLERLAKGDSFWSPYLDIVPNRFNLPISWPAKDIASLEGTGLVEIIGNPEEDLIQNFLKIAKKFKCTKGLGVDQLRQLYFYAGSFVSSYSFMEEDGEIVMVPMADMLNHKTGHNNARLFFEKDRLQMICVKDIPQGEQVYNTYGDLGNAELLFKYGYMDDPNPHSAVSIDIGEFFEFIEEHTCPIHTPSAFKLNEMEKLLDKGSLPPSTSLKQSMEVSKDIFKWFAKGFKSGTSEAACYGCIRSFLVWKKATYATHFDRTNKNQRLASQLVAEQQAIIDRYIALIDANIMAA